MDEIPDEIRKMFPDQPIHKLDIVDGELQILASAEPLEPDPHFEDMPIEQVNQYLREHGYDPEQVGIRGKILVDALIENVNLRAENKRLREALEEIRDLARTGLPPVEMTEPYWQQHRANKIASIAHRALKGGE